MSLYKRSNSPFWYFEFECDGMRHRGSTRTPDRRKALGVFMVRHTEALAAKRARSLAEMEARFTLASRTPPPMASVGRPLSKKVPLVSPGKQLSPRVLMMQARAARRLALQRR